LNIGGTIKAGAFDVKCVQAIHSSSFPDGGYGGTAMGFIATSTHESFYYSGDTGIFGDMTLIGEYHHLDFAVFPIGGTFTMDSTDAIRAAKLCKASKVVGVHYNTFPPIKIDLNTIKKQFEESNIKLILLEIGQEIELE
jgi:L-ascorbate metabolism protein UlaG (beta-lactamase superfamily)